MPRTTRLVASSNFARTSVAVKPPKEMKHQTVSLAHDEKNECVLDCSDAGTGKTMVRIVGFARRRKKGAGCALILAPRSLLHSTWAVDFKKFAPHLKVSVATAAKREAAFKVDADAYITNHDAVKWLVKQKPAFFEKFTELILDEPTAYKHHTSQRSRAICKIAHLHFQKKPKVHRAGMTATPNSNGIVDVWHQVYLLDFGKRLGSSFYAFRNSVCTPKQIGRDKNAIEWRDKEGAEEAVFAELADIVIRHKLDDCTDIPKTHFYEVPYALPPAQRKAYDQLELAQLLMLIPDQVAAKLTGTQPKITLTAINAAAVATKLLQVCSGAVYDNTGKYHVIDTGRYELIIDLVLARVKQHPIVYFQWKHQKEQLVEHAKAAGLNYAVIDGESLDKERNDIVAAYQNGLYDVVFGHPRSMAHGLTLTRGTSIIWAGPIYDLELVEQGNKRQRRIGQKHKTEVVTVLAEDTIEEKVYELLQGKDERMKNLLDLFSSLLPKIARKKAA
jgi:SNF2 family DNA or RNA helicase